MRVVKGIYEQGTIRLLEPLDLPDQQEVTLLLAEPDLKDHPALRYAGMLSDLTPEEQQALEASLQQRVRLSRVWEP
jgi:predicted DNA-binding antitoxin AbrB/MazE fold protein